MKLHSEQASESHSLEISHLSVQMEPEGIQDDFEITAYYRSVEKFCGPKGETHPSRAEETDHLQVRDVSSNLTCVRSDKSYNSK